MSPEIPVGPVVVAFTPANEEAPRKNVGDRVYFRIVIADPAGLEGTMPIIKSKDNNMEGTPPLTGRALPNLLMQSVF